LFHKSTEPIGRALERALAGGRTKRGARPARRAYRYSPSRHRCCAMRAPPTFFLFCRRLAAASGGRKGFGAAPARGGVARRTASARRAGGPQPNARRAHCCLCAHVEAAAPRHGQQRRQRARAAERRRPRGHPARSGAGTGHVPRRRVDAAVRGSLACPARAAHARRAPCSAGGARGALQAPFGKRRRGARHACCCERRAVRAARVSPASRCALRWGNRAGVPRQCPRRDAL
jgi:hypothetical protein